MKSKERATYDLDLLPDEVNRLRVAADKNGMSPEEWISRIVRANIALSERLGARMPDPRENPLDIR